MQPSPYTPGSVARFVPGRRAQLAFYEERAQSISALHAFSARIRVDVAARGVGKTSLLREAERILLRHDVRTVWVTANEDESLVGSILAELRPFAGAGSKLGAALLSAIDSASLTVGIPAAKASVTVKKDRAPAPSSAKAFLAAIVRATEAIVGDGGSGLAILIDEVQSADRASLRTIGYAWQELASLPEPPRAGLFAVGLPGSRDHITSAVTFSERFDFAELAGIDDAGVADALVTPAREAGVLWEPDAVRLAVERAGGYPYKVQLLGDAAWGAAGRPDPGSRIARAHVESGMPEVDRHMRSLFQVRWRNASRRQRELLVAIAQLGGEDVKREDIAAHLGVRTTQISMARDGLLRKGVIDASRYGMLSFTVPGFTAYIIEHAE